MKEFVEIGLPEKMTVKHTIGSLLITRKWFGWEYFVIAAFAIYWNKIYLKGISELTALEGLSLLHPLIGVALLYVAVSGLLNRTEIEVSHQKVLVKHKPLPWIGSKSIDAQDIKQLYSKEFLSKNSKGTPSYEVHVIAHSGKDTKLVDGLKTSQQALYVEQEIEKYLNIDNAPVRGEIG